MPEIPQCERKNMNQVYLQTGFMSDDEDRERPPPHNPAKTFALLVMTPATLLET
jgi:hypothetical protein